MSFCWVFLLRLKNNGNPPHHPIQGFRFETRHKEFPGHAQGEKLTYAGETDAAKAGFRDVSPASTLLPQKLAAPKRLYKLVLQFYVCFKGVEELTLVTD